MNPPSGQSVRAAVIQLELPNGDLEGNRAAYRDALLGLGDADLVVTPELFISGYDLKMIDEIGAQLSEPLDGPTVEMTKEIAAEKDFTVVVGLLERGEDGNLYDTAVTVTPAGDAVPYRKSHLFPTEFDRFKPGHELFVVPTPAGLLGPQICFEHAFPAIATTLAMEGAQIIVIPSAVGDGYDHLLTLRSRARAQDNQIFVVAANLNGNGFCGHSLITDPRGHVLASAGHGDAILRADLDLSLTGLERRQERSLSLARPELYVSKQRTDR